MAVATGAARSMPKRSACASHAAEAKGGWEPWTAHRPAMAGRSTTPGAGKGASAAGKTATW
eukprot:38334-Alexandrium_andersonii.AAC.1